MATTILEPRYVRRHFGNGGLWQVARVVDFLFGLLYAVLGIRLLLVLIDARPGTGFVRFVNAISDPFYAPFRGIVPSGTYDAHTVAWPIVVAIVAYMVLHALIRALLGFLNRAA